MGPVPEFHCSNVATDNGGDRKPVRLWTVLSG